MNQIDLIPPHDIRIECACIGAMIVDPGCISEIIGIIAKEDFYRVAHRNIFSSIMECYDQSFPVDLISVVAQLKSNKQLDVCGGTSYLATLTSNAGSGANIQYYTGQIKELSNRRKLLRLSSSMEQNSYRLDLTVPDIAEEAEKQLFDIIEGNNSDQIHPLKELIYPAIETMEKYCKGGSYPAVRTGYKEIDTLIGGFKNSEFIIIGARPSIGKTSFALNIAERMTTEFNYPVGFFSLEMSSDLLVMRLICSSAKITTDAIHSGLLRPYDFKKITEAANRLYQAPLYIQSSPNIKILYIKAISRRMKSLYGVRAIFIDYVSLIIAENVKGIPRHEQIAEISRSLKSLARELEIPIIALSQVRRETEGRRPNLADLRESGSLEQDADVVIFLHRDKQKSKEENMITDVNIAKNRNGPTGNLALLFVPKYTQFISYEGGKQFG